MPQSNNEEADTVTSDVSNQVSGTPRDVSNRVSTPGDVSDLAEGEHARVSDGYDRGRVRPERPLLSAEA